MIKTIKIFRSFAEAEAADKEYYRSLTSAQRIQIVLMLRNQHHAKSSFVPFVLFVAATNCRSELVNAPVSVGDITFAIYLR